MHRVGRKPLKVWTTSKIVRKAFFRVPRWRCSRGTPSAEGVLTSFGRQGAHCHSYKSTEGGEAWQWRSTMRDRRMPGPTPLVSSNRFRSMKDSILGLGPHRGIGGAGDHSGSSEKSRLSLGQRYRRDKSWAKTPPLETTSDRWGRAEKCDRRWTKSSGDDERSRGKHRGLKFTPIQ